ncbi:ribonuclease HII [Mycoplasma leonicaptivi]|uniref:ribonuclease HII n=1 Tax=Mycoplasma leonicaptivi TaxID=36742 RepID=UPI000486E60A|nr:ribonuclease HII [Mycoplasma leonicaptivi]
MKFFQNFDENYKNKYKRIAGCDEVGRGCLAGPLVTACVILPNNYQNTEIKDSKKLSEQKREQLFKEIEKVALEIKISIRSVEQINNSNPKKESILGMEECVNNFNKVDFVITDYEKLDINIPQINLIKGDNLSQSVAAASIIAKVTRDRILNEIHKKFPQYDFINNKGYGTKKHIEAIQKHGIIDGFYRTKYKPVKKLLENKVN